LFNVPKLNILLRRGDWNG